MLPRLFFLLSLSLLPTTTLVSGQKYLALLRYDRFLRCDDPSRIVAIRVQRLGESETCNVNITCRSSLIHIPGAPLTEAAYCFSEAPPLSSFLGPGLGLGLGFITFCPTCSYCTRYTAPAVNPSVDCATAASLPDRYNYTEMTLYRTNVCTIAPSGWYQRFANACTTEGYPVVEPGLYSDPQCQIPRNDTGSTATPDPGTVCVPAAPACNPASFTPPRIFVTGCHYGSSGAVTTTTTTTTMGQTTTAPSVASSPSRPALAIVFFVLMATVAAVNV